MILLLLDFLNSNWGWKIPLVFEYYSTRMILAALTTLFLSIGLGPRFIKKLYEMKIGQTIRIEDCPLLGKLHQAKQDTPTMGGLLILLSMLVSLFLWMDLTHVFTLILTVSTLFLGAIGAYDDYLKLKHSNTKGLSARRKMFYQTALSCGIALYLLCPAVADGVHARLWFTGPVVKQELQFNLDEGVSQEGNVKSLRVKDYASLLYLPFIKQPVYRFTGIGLLFAALLIVFVIVGSSNAVNLTDGLDGLAAGCLVMVAATLALVAFVSNNRDLAHYLNILYIEGSGEIAIYLSAFAGACLGFLWYNGHPAQVFMGDTGSLALGGILGVSAVLLKKEFLLAIIGGIFVLEALSVILQVASFRLYKKRIFLCAPLHHHFEYKGWPETKIVTRFWIVGLLLTLIGIVSLKFQ